MEALPIKHQLQEERQEPKTEIRFSRITCIPPLPSKKLQNHLTYNYNKDTILVPAITQEPTSEYEGPTSEPNNQIDILRQKHQNL